MDKADTLQTKGRALEELNEMFNDRVPAYRFSKYQTTKDKATCAIDDAGRSSVSLDQV